MNRDIYSQAEQLNKKHRRKRTWYKILSVPICLVVIVTTYVLILPAITMESTLDTSCGIAEQVHTDDCYELPGTPAHKEIQCTDGADVPTDAAQGGNVPGDAVQSTDAANDDTPEDDAAVNSTPAQAPAASDPIDVTGVELTITDNVSASGCYEAAVTGGDAALEGRNVQYQWYKSTNGGANYTPVKATNFTVGGNTVSNISGDHGEKLFLALDGGTVSDTLPSVTYKAVLMVDGTVYDSVWAECTNTIHQASVLNGSFEAPDLTSYWFQQFVPEGTTGLFWKTTASNEEGGQPAYPSVEEKENDTEENDGKHYIEIIDTGLSNDHHGQASVHHKQGTATNGKQYAEINAGAAGALYQTIATIPGTTMYWSVDHSGRDGTDTMAVVMMPESKAKSIATQEQLQQVLNNPSNYGATVASNLSAEKGVWTTHSGQYTIPAEQYETRFFFMAVSTYNDKNYIGNHIDNVWFSQQIPPASAEKPYFTLTKHVVGLTEDDLQLLSGKLTFTVQKSTNSSFTNPETVKTYTATNLGSWTPNEDGSWTLSARISMKDQELGDYYRIVESGADLDGFNLTATDTNAAVLLRSTTVADFTFTNTYADAGRALTLKKFVRAPDTTGSFTFTVSYTDAGGQQKSENVTLKNGDSNTITGIPKGVKVTVTETNPDGYTVTMKDHNTGTDLAVNSSYTFAMNNNTAVDIYNTSTVALPETGGIGREVFLVAGIALMLSAVITGCLLRRRFGKEGD